MLIFGYQGEYQRIGRTQPVDHILLIAGGAGGHRQGSLLVIPVPRLEVRLRRHQLRHDRGVVMPAGDAIENFRAAKKKLVDAFEHDYVERLLASTGGNVSAAARVAGLDRSNFRRLLKRAAG